MNNGKCPTCGKTVYFAEKVRVLDKDFHKLCFKCADCGKPLSPRQFSDKDNKPYCKTCYDSKFRLKGYGHGGSTDSFNNPSNADIINKS